MSGSSRVNPLLPGALTADTVGKGDYIICWKPGDSESTRRHLKIVSSAYQDEDEHWVVDIAEEAGRTETVFAHEVGLAGHHQTGEWTHIAVPDLENG